MEESTTTDVVTQDTGAEIAQPEEQQTEAVQTTDPEPTLNDQSSSDEVSTDETQSDDVWAKKGIDISTQEGQAKAAKMYADAQKALTQKAQKASELEKQLSTPSGYEDDRILALETKYAVRDFFDRNPEARALEQDMAKYITESGKSDLVKQGWLTLDEVHAIVASNPNRESQLKAEGRTEGLQALANRQRTVAVNGNAVNKATAPKVTSSNVDEWWTSLSPSERQNPENRRQLDSLL